MHAICNHAAHQAFAQASKHREQAQEATAGLVMAMGHNPTDLYNTYMSYALAQHGGSFHAATHSTINMVGIRDKCLPAEVSYAIKHISPLLHPDTNYARISRFFNEQHLEIQEQD